jgi:dGTPase
LITRTDIEQLEKSVLAPYAVYSQNSQGRKHNELEHAYRTRFQRDRDRVIHSSAFRRLEYKTQVFVYREGDYYRTRLTHSLEVAQIARSISKSPQLNEDLTEAVSLAHDLGHPPFGHTGQAVLNKLMKPFGGFEHNQQSLRIVKFLEKKYPEFDGLNLSWEILEGICKHKKDPENPITVNSKIKNPSLEGQVADRSDAIAYTAHDLDDGITSGLLNASQLSSNALWKENETELEKGYSNLDDKLKKYLMVRNIINKLVSDFRENTTKNIKQYEVRSPDDIRTRKEKIGDFSSEVKSKLSELKNFLFKNMYHHPRVLRMDFKAEIYLTNIFKAYMSNNELLPPSVLSKKHLGEKERLICDYISGMTDRFAISEYKNLFSPDT